MTTGDNQKPFQQSADFFRAVLFCATIACGAITTVETSADELPKTKTKLTINTTVHAPGETLTTIKQRLDGALFNDVKQAARSRSLSADQELLAIEYTVTNVSEQDLIVFGTETIGLEPLPTISSDSDDGAIQLLIGSYVDPTVSFMQQPYLSGSLLSPAQSLSNLLVIAWPLIDSWQSNRTYQPEVIKLCIGATNVTTGVGADTLGGDTGGQFWPMGPASPIRVCADISVNEK